MKCGQVGIDILLVPSKDWKEITPYHTHMAIVRGIENGFSVVRQTYEGLSASADFNGNVLSTMNHFYTDEKVLVSEVPIGGITTIYNIIGDLFAWFNIVAFILFVLFRFKKIEEYVLKGRKFYTS